MGADLPDGRTGEDLWDLPDGWTVAPLGSLVDVLDHKRVPVNADERSKRLGDVPYYGATGQVGWIDDYLFDEELLLLGEDGAPFLDKSKPIAFLIGGKSWVNNHAHVLRAIDGMTTNRFLLHYLNSFEFDGHVTGSTRLKLTQRSMREIPVLLPPLPEQRRIVAKVEALLSRVNAARDRLARVPAILKRFRQSVLAAGCSGRLSDRGVPVWRADDQGEDLPEGWRRFPLSSLLLGIEAGKNVRCEEHPPRADEQGVVKISAVTWGEYDEDESKTPLVQSALAETTAIQPGDFLISRANTIDLVGSCVIVHQVSRRLHLSDKVLRLRFADDTLKEWTLLVLRSPAGRRLIEARATGNQASMRNITQPQLRAIPVPLPPPDQLVDVVRRVETLFALANIVEQRAATALRRSDRLTQSILSNAVRGELVSPQAAE